jgi:hypothetical protein
MDEEQAADGHKICRDLHAQFGSAFRILAFPFNGGGFAHSSHHTPPGSCMMSKTVLIGRTGQRVEERPLIRNGNSQSQKSIHHGVAPTNMASQQRLGRESEGCTELLSSAQMTSR